MKITKITLQGPVKAADQSGLSESDKKIINNGGCLYPKREIDIFDRTSKPIVKQGGNTQALTPKTSIVEGGASLTESDKRIINGGGCLYPNPRSLNFAVELPTSADLNKKIAKVDTVKFEQKAPNSGLSDSDFKIINSGGCVYPNQNRLKLELLLQQNGTENSKVPQTGQQSTPNTVGSDNQTNSVSKTNQNVPNSLIAPMPGDIAPVSGRSLTLAPPATSTNPPAKPGAVVRSASFLAGEAVGLGKSLVSGVVDVGKFLYDVESAVIARGHDLIFEGTLNGSFTQVYEPTSSLGTASSEGRGGEAAVKIITEAPDRIADASVRTGILVEQGKYYEAGEAFGKGPLAEATAALGTVQLATTTPLRTAAPAVTTAVEAGTTQTVTAVAPKVAVPIPTTILRPGPFAEVISQARATAGGIAGDCEGATAVIRSVLKEAERGNWSWRDSLGRPGFHEFAKLPDGRILDATAGQYLANGMVTAQEVASVPGLGAAIESGVFTAELHNALRALVTR